MKQPGLISSRTAGSALARRAVRAAACCALLVAATLRAPVLPAVDAQGAAYNLAATWPIATSAFGTPVPVPAPADICGRFDVATTPPPEYTIFYDRDGTAYLTAMCGNDISGRGWGSGSLLAFKEGGQGDKPPAFSQFADETRYRNHTPMTVNAYDPVRNAVYGAWRCCWFNDLGTFIEADKGAIAALELDTGRMDRGRIWNTYATEASPDSEEIFALAVDGSRGVVAASASGLTRYTLPRSTPMPKRVTDTHGSAFVPGWLASGSDGSFYGIQRSGAGGVTRLNAALDVDSDWQLESPWPDMGPLANYAGTDTFYAVDVGPRDISIRVFGRDGRTIRHLPVPAPIVTDPRPQLAVGPDGRYGVLGLDEGGRLLFYMLSPTGAIWRAIVVLPGETLTAFAGQPIERRVQIASAYGSTLIRAPAGQESVIFDDTGTRTDVLRLPPDTIDALPVAGGDVILRRGHQRGVATLVERIGTDGNVGWSTELSGAAMPSPGLALAGERLSVVLGDGGEIETLDAASGEHIVREQLDPVITNIASGPHGSLYILRRESSVVVSLKPDRTELDTGSMVPLTGQPLGSMPIALAVGQDGRIAAAFREADDPAHLVTEVIVFDGFGRQVWRLASSWFSQRALAADDLAFDADGRLLVYAAPEDAAAPRAPGSVFVFAPDARVVTATPPAGRPGAATPTVTPTPAPASGGKCRIAGDKWAAPTEVALGESVTVTLTLDFDCPPARDKPTDVMLVLDRSASMARSPLERALAAAKAFLDITDAAQNRVGLASFGPNARLDVRLTHAKDAVARRLDYEGMGMTSISAGLNLAYDHLRANGRPDAQWTVLLISDGGHNRGALPQGTARRMREAGITVYVVAIGVDANEALLLELTGSRERYIVEWQIDRLATLVQAMMRKAFASRSPGRLTDIMSPDVTLLRSPIAPLPDAVGGANVAWAWSALPRDPVTMTYRVRPNHYGEMPTNTEAYIDYVDADGTLRRFVYPIPRVRVPDNRPSPTTTHTPSPTLTATPGPTPTPTLTVERPRPILYLPLAIREPACTPDRRRVDVALVIDASVSMLDPTAAGRTKLEAALTAAELFVGRLQLGRGDQAAVVSFNSAAAMHQGLTSDGAALTSALRAIAPSSMTCILCGIETATAELGSARRRPDHTPVIILLTDGRANPGPIEAAVAAAATAKASGTVIFTIGLGQDVETDALTAMASKPESYYFAPDGEQLAQVYAQIAADLPCPDTNWPRAAP